jgi:hypothetical protein
MEEQVIDDALVLQGEWGQFVGQREDDMHVAGTLLPAIKLSALQARLAQPHAAASAARAASSKGQCRG